MQLLKHRVLSRAGLTAAQVCYTDESHTAVHTLRADAEAVGYARPPGAGGAGRRFHLGGRVEVEVGEAAHAAVDAHQPEAAVVLPGRSLQLSQVCCSQTAATQSETKPCDQEPLQSRIYEEMGILQV